MGKNVLVIGASGDIGQAIVERLAEDGYQLILHYHKNSEAMMELRRKIKDKGVLSVIQADLSNEKETNEFLNQLVFRIDIVVFASGKAEFRLFQETSDTLMDQMLNLHVKAPWKITRQVLPNMVQQHFGNIIFITSIWGNVGASYEVVYSSVKGAQNSFVKALAKEVGPSGISVNAISPGFIDTKMNRSLSEEEKAQVISEIPVNRAGLPSEIAHAVSFLLDEKSSYIQGEILNINGGW
ncbi:SDR family oxidoreductase [Oceanobacillus caeni]|uniref:elongation factor P 5-aminopentanone reductase n=1 Tax=Oceanobacillus caeni TaxID=405946 RepID=UPI0006213488|nr:SDR family oxidoreductase [Oceanobacillus caeni]KKE78424.1 3-ketoacyl-ACP reductase [Bacilli bacterium VT-13-104]PZD88620.1 SDR family NAD(P)-dependent oxidoreductase [Bacilli bacterium]MBU8790035.1 SDR family oxidoreductase [Oceanobacillus caeni]MCR1833194.1 SDR family oxidoreductase [Oceanobacillus caeni]PZD89913.1 SDR family NAD(P)-dependent oxidoreductase [Bacilli bacterium]